MVDPNCSWNVLRFDPNGDQGDDAIYRAVGRALSRWEEMEYECAHLYTALLQVRGQAATRGYGLLAAFSARMPLLEAALAEFSFRDRQPFIKFGATLNEIGNLAARRNDIAHGTVCHTNQGRWGFYLLPAGYSTKKHKDGDKPDLWPTPFGGATYAFTSAQIDTYAGHFIRLQAEVKRMTVEVWRAWPEIQREDNEGIQSALFPPTP